MVHIKRRFFEPPLPPLIGKIFIFSRNLYNPQERPINEHQEVVLQSGISTDKPLAQGGTKGQRIGWI
jgi:hypothetical protein